MNKRMILLLLVLPTMLITCNLPVAVATPRRESSPSPVTPGADTSLLATIVAATMQALTPVRLPSATSTPAFTDTPTATLITPTATRTPTTTPAPSATPTASPTETSLPGTISGGIYGYPYGSIPRLVIVAFNQEKPYYWWVILPAGSTWYSMDAFIPAGRYQVVAYDAAGHAGGCPSTVTVKGGQVATCDITDWGGGYRARLADVPTP